MDQNLIILKNRSFEKPVLGKTILLKKRYFSKSFLQSPVVCDNYMLQWWVEFDDEFSWLFTNRFSATRYIKVKRMGITEFFRKIWLFSVKETKSSESMLCTVGSFYGSESDCFEKLFVWKNTLVKKRSDLQKKSFYKQVFPKKHFLWKTALLRNNSVEKQFF